MAPFNPGLNPTNDPTYLNNSRGYNKSDVAVDTSLGKALGDVAGLVGPTVNAVDQGIQKSARDDLYTEIDRIRAEHGSDLSPDEVTAIAGKGGRGSKYAAASDATTSGVAPANDDLAMEEADVPPGVETKISGLKRMKAAYDGGKLSDSHYYSSLEAAVKEIRSRYPGYREQIDSMVSSITGVTPANALRTSIKQDMQSMAAASTAAANKIETQFLKQQEYLQTLKPGLTLQEYAANKQLWDVKAGLLQARDYQIKSEGAELELMDKKDKNTARTAERTYTNAANQIVTNFMKGTINNLQVKSEELAKKGPNADPKEVQALAQEWQVLEGQLRLQLKTKARQPLSPGSSNSYATYMTPAQVQAVEDQAVSVMKPVIANLGTKETGAAYSSANIIKNRDSQDVLKMQDKFPAARALGAAQTSMGPQVAGVLSQQSDVLPEVTKAMTDLTWLTVADKSSGNPPPPVTDMINAHKGGDPQKHVDPKVARVTVKGLQILAEHPDPEVAARAVESLYADPTFFANVNDRDKLAIYTSLGSREFTQKMIQLGKTKPEARDQYFNWMETNFLPVFKQGADDLQRVVTDKRYDWSFSPKDLQFSAKTKPGFEVERNQFGGRAPDPAQASLTSINRGLRALSPILREKYGDDAPAHVAQMIQNMPGVNFGAQKEGTVLQGLAGAVGGWFKEHVKFTAPEEIMGVKVDNIPEGMSARDFMRMLQKREQTKEAPGK